ncbi:MAG: tRNA1Val (adenine37-N6)-methyltransferase, partial [Granulosicoccus sp.]
MPNCVFQFKQFAVWSHIGGFKVGTDAVLLGAWADVSRSNSILEIGTGTGVIAMMMAQRTQASITAVELDVNAASQAEYNFQRSSFGGLRVKNEAIQDFAGSSEEKYDHVVCNPPFFQSSSKPDSDTLQKAKHTDSLDPSELMACSARLTNEDARLSLVVPFSDLQLWIESAQSSGFYPTRKLLVRPAPEFDFKRVLIEFEKSQGPCIEQEITLEEGESENRTYTVRFQEMMK